MTRNPDNRTPYGSTALRNAHVVLVAAAIVFVFGFAVYLVLVMRPRRVEGAATWPIEAGVVLSCLAGLGLLAYLRRFLRKTSG